MRGGRSAPSMPCRSPAASRSSGPTGSATWANSTASTCSWRKAARRPAASTACWSRPATSSARRRWPRAPSAPTTSSSSPTAPPRRNKMVVQALLAPGDIAVVDRNCHKSHHYGMVLAGAQPLLCRGLPDDGILDVRRGAARHHQARAAGAEGRGASRSAEAARPDQLHLRRAHVQRHAG